MLQFPVLLNPGLGGMKDVAFSSFAHEQTQSNGVCCEIIYGIQNFAVIKCDGIRSPYLQ